MDRSSVVPCLDAQVKQFLSPDYRVAATAHPAWCDAHPAGVGLIAPTDLGEIFFVDPDKIYETIGHLPPSKQLHYLTAIAVWWQQSLLYFTTGIETELVVQSFAEQYPFHAEAIASVATHHGYSLSTWLAPERMSDAPDSGVGRTADPA